MEDVVNPWLGRRVFLTGHTGFIGGWLALWLAAKGAQIRGYSLDPATEPNLFTVASLEDVLDDVRGDIRDYQKLHASLNDLAPEVVLHLAAQPLVRRSYVDPLGTYAINVTGTAHVLAAVRCSPSIRAVACVTPTSAMKTTKQGSPIANPTRFVDVTLIPRAKPVLKSLPQLIAIPISLRIAWRSTGGQLSRHAPET